MRNLGFARKDVEEALQARFNLISSWKSFLSGAVQTWQEYTALFQQQEQDLQERIQQAHIAFAAAKAQAEQSQVEAGKITPIEIKDDEEELEGANASRSFLRKDSRGTPESDCPHFSNCSSRPKPSRQNRKPQSAHARKVHFLQRQWRQADRSIQAMSPNRLLSRPVVHDVYV